MHYFPCTISVTNVLISQADLVEKEYNALRAFLLVAASCQKPTPLPYQTLPSELEEAMKTVIKGKENHRGDREWFEHIAFVAEAATAAGWIAHVCSRFTTNDLHLTTPLAYPCTVHR